jgi:hypothetical protein
VDIGAPGFGWLEVAASCVVDAAWDVLAEAQDASRPAAVTAVIAVTASDAARRPRRPRRPQGRTAAGGAAGWVVSISWLPFVVE